MRYTPLQRILEALLIRPSFLGPWVVAGFFLVVTGCGVQRLLSEADNSVELRQSMEERGKEKIAWRMARKLDDFDAYRNFLLLYSDGTFAEAAQAALEPYDERLWNEIQWAENGAYRLTDYLLISYLDLFPNGLHLEEAREAYFDLDDSERWYTMPFDSLSRARAIFFREDDDDFNLHRERLEGQVQYLRQFPKGVLNETITERLARTFIGYRLLPVDRTAAPRRLPLEPAVVENLTDGLSVLPGLPARQRKVAQGYLNTLLEERSSLWVADADNNSIIDELEMPELRRVPRPGLHPETLERLEKPTIISYSGILDDGIGQPVSGVVVQAVNLKDGRVSETITDEAGSFSLELEAGANYRVRFEHGYFMEKVMELDVPEKQEGPLQAGSISLVVLPSAAPETDPEDKRETTDETSSEETTPGEEAVVTGSPSEAGAPAPTPEALLEASNERGLRSVTSGQFKYDPIPELTVGEPYLFKLEIIPSDSSGPVSSVINSAETVSKSIRLSNEMAVHIVAAEQDFTIQPVSDMIQPIEPGSGTLWSWNITPLQAGTHDVVVNIEIITKSELTGDLRRKSINVYNEPVRVVAKEKEVIEEPVTEDRFFSPYFYLLLLLPVGGITYYFLSRKKQAPAVDDTQPFGAGETGEHRAFLQRHSNEILTLVEHAEQEIGKGHTGKALEPLLDFFNNRHYPIHQELVTLAARFNQYQREYNLGLNPDPSIPNRVNMALLDLLNRLHRVLEGAAA